MVELTLVYIDNFFFKFFFRGLPLFNTHAIVWNLAPS